MLFEDAFAFRTATVFTLGCYFLSSGLENAISFSCIPCHWYIGRSLLRCWVAIGLCRKEGISWGLYYWISHLELPIREEVMNSWIWPDYGNSSVGPLVKFQTSHLFCDRSKVYNNCRQAQHTCPLEIKLQRRGSWASNQLPEVFAPSSAWWPGRETPAFDSLL